MVQSFVSSCCKLLCSFHTVGNAVKLLPQISSWKFLKKYHHRLLKIVPFETIFTFSTHAPKVYFAQS